MKLSFISKRVLFFLSVIFFCVLLIGLPEISRQGVANGILLCGRVIIPSLFPFTMCVLFIINLNVLDSLNFLSPLTKKIFHLNFYEFAVFLLSAIGGYPVGAKMLNESVNAQKITPIKGAKMLCYCVNAGPAFIISAVGSAQFNSKIIGLVLFFSHILASLCICFFLQSEDYIENTENRTPIPLSDNFVLSAADTSKSLISICSFVILFSAVNSYLLYFSEKLHFLKTAALLLEVTNALNISRNIYIISFVLGFGGICIWFQVFSAADKLKINYLKFAFFRILHGSLSAGFTYLLVKIFKITVPTAANGISFKVLYSTPAVTLSLIIMVIVFSVSLTAQKYNCKISENVI